MEPPPESAIPPADDSLPRPGTDALSNPIELPAAVWSSLLAFLVVGLLVMVGTPGALAMLGAGFLCVIFYRQRCRVASIGPRIGAKLGALAGAIGAAILAALLGLGLAMGMGPKVQETFLKQLQDYAAQNSDPRVPQVLELAKTHDGFVLMLTLGLVMTFAASVLLSALGGLLGAILLRRKHKV